MRGWFVACWIALAFAPATRAAEGLTPSQMEEQGLLHVRREFQRIGRTIPQLDPALTAAARKLAQEALDKSADEAADLLAISQVVSDAGGFDPTPRAVVVRASPAGYALEAFTKRTDYNEEPATHVGVGAIQVGKLAVVVALLSERKAGLDDFPRRLDRASFNQRLCGELKAALRSAELYITRPNGAVDRLAASAQRGGRFCSTLAFPTSGRHTVEVIGRGTKGPEVAALFFVDVGVKSGDAVRLRIPEPNTLAEARAVLLTRINGLRAAHQAPPLVADSRLAEVAQAHSDKMAEGHFFAHVSPAGDDLRQRLNAAGYAYVRAGENLGLAAGAVAAHFAIEHSPGHRRNLLDPGFTHLGVGIAFETVGDRRQAILTEVLAKPADAAPDPLAAAYQAISEQRAGKKLPPLVRSPVLEAIATEHARRALQLDRPKISLPGATVHDRVFQSMREVKSAAVDFYVSDDPSALPDSRSLEDSRNDRVGIGAVQGSSATYGDDKYWVVVIYADSQ